MRIKLNKDFYLILAFFVFVFLLYIQYDYAKANIIKTFKNQKLTETLFIKNKFKTIFDNTELIFKSKLKDNLQKLYYLYAVYNGIKNFNPNKIAKLLNKNEKKGYYEVFVIDKNYRIIKSSYKPDLGYNLGQFPIFRKILNSVFQGKKKIDISPIYIDPASMNLKRYFLILSPDKKYLLQIAYVINIYPKIKKVYFSIKKQYEDLKVLNLFFVSKYLIYPIHFDNKKLKKISLETLVKQTIKILKNLNKSNEIDKNISKEIFKIFQKKGFIDKLKSHSYILYTIINGFFKDFSNKLIIECIYDTTNLEKNLNDLKKNYLFILLLGGFIVIFIELVSFYVSFKLNELVKHMKKNEKIEKSFSFIKEIDELIYTYNWYRARLTEEIEKNRNILQQNRQFIIDTVHQIKTPLSIIRLNIDFIKMKLNPIDKDIKEALDEIDAAISMLTVSFEDLSYLSSEEVVEYKPVEINLSKVIKERIKFFNNLAKAKNKKLIFSNEKDFIFRINKMEFERIVDNNISNAIEYSTGEEIIIELKNGILKFISKGKKIKNPNLIFEKNYREHIHKRGLGVGLNIVKKICEKYGIEYKAYYKDGKNIFEYRFKI